MIQELIYIVFCVFLAAQNAGRIKEGKKISHFLNGSIHVISGLVAGYFWGWWLAPAILLTARIFFSSALNLFRGLPLFYVTLAKHPGSFVDRVERKIFGNNGELVLFLYLAGWIGINIKILL